MADFDKDGIMNILGSLLGSEKAEQASGIVDKVTEAMSPPSAEDKAAASGGATGNLIKNDDSLFDTAEMMGHITNIMGKVNNAKNSRDYQLFNAIRPYMNTARQTKLGTCLKIVQAVSIMNEFKKDYKK